MNMLGQPHQQANIDRDQALTPVDDDFECLICKNVVQNPVSCFECDRLFCKLCLTQWRERRSCCPHCRSQTAEVGRVSRILVKQLNKVKFRCSDCEQVFTVDDCDKHGENCNRKVRLQCTACNTHVFRCNLQDLKKTVKTHLQIDCVRRVGLQCYECKKVLKRSQLKNHECITKLEQQTTERMLEAVTEVWDRF